MRKPIVGLILGAMATLGFLPASAQSAQVLTSAQIVEVFVGKTIKQVDDRYWAFYEPGGKLGGLYVNDEDQGRWVFLVTDCANDGIVGMRTSRLASMF